MKFGKEVEEALYADKRRDN